MTAAAAGGAGRSRASKIRSAAATPAGPVWYSADSRRSGAKNSGVRSSTARAGANATSPPISRTLTSIATNAVAAVAPHSSTSVVWKAVRKTSIVVSAFRRPTASTTVACSCARPNIFSVGSPRNTSRKCALVHASSRSRRAVASRTRRPISPRSSTRTGPATTRIRTDQGSSTKTVAATMAGTTRWRIGDTAITARGSRRHRRRAGRGHPIVGRGAPPAPHRTSTP